MKSRKYRRHLFDFADEPAGNLHHLGFIAGTPLFPGADRTADVESIGFDTKAQACPILLFRVDESCDGAGFSSGTDQQHPVGERIECAGMTGFASAEMLFNQPYDIKRGPADGLAQVENEIRAYWLPGRTS